MTPREEVSLRGVLQVGAFAAVILPQIVANAKNYVNFL